MGWLTSPLLAFPIRPSDITRHSWTRIRVTWSHHCGKGRHSPHHKVPRRTTIILSITTTTTTITTVIIQPTIVAFLGRTVAAMAEAPMKTAAPAVVDLALIAMTTSWTHHKFLVSFAYLLLYFNQLIYIICLCERKFRSLKLLQLPDSIRST